MKFHNILIVFFCIFLLSTPLATRGVDEWMNHSLGKYMEKLNDAYLKDRMDDYQIEKNTDAFIHELLTPEDLDLLKNPKLAELLSFPHLYDGKEILFYGEAIGQPMQRKEYTWVNVMDEDNNSIGCWTPNVLAETIHFYGRYGYKGDLLLVKGIYHVSNEAHGGETEIAVNDILILSTGHPVESEPIQQSFVYYMGVIVLGIVILLAYQKNRDKKEAARLDDSD